MIWDFGVQGGAKEAGLLGVGWRRGANGRHVGRL